MTLRTRERNSMSSGITTSSVTRFCIDGLRQTSEAAGQVFIEVAEKCYSKPAIQSHKGFRSSSSSANPRMSLSSSIACAKALFRVLHAAGDARVAGKVESDHGNLGMYRLCPEQNGFRLLNAFGASKRIGETDPPGLRFPGQPLQDGWQPLRPYPISWPPCRG